MEEGKIWDYQTLKELNIIDIIPVLDSAGQVHPKIDYLLELLNYKNINEIIKVNNPLLILALENSVKNKKMAETIFISSLIIQGRKLSNVSSHEVAMIMNSWKEFGLEEEMISFAREWLIHRLIIEVTSGINLKS